MEDPSRPETSYTCAICFQDLEKTTPCSLQPCQHEFCKECVMKLRAQNYQLKCPLCRCIVESAKTVSLLQVFTVLLQNSAKLRCCYFTNTHTKTNT